MEAFYERLLELIARYRDNRDAAGTFARRLAREISHLWIFLENVSHPRRCDPTAS
jgi:hypothetical protein